MKLVITGSSGQLGSYLVEHFSATNEVIGLDNRKNQFREAAGFSRKVDIATTKALRKFISDADWVIHSAAQVSVENSLNDPLFDAENNVLGTVNLLWNSHRCNVKNFLYISSAAVYGSPIEVPIAENHPTIPMSPYGASKLCGETYVRAFSEAFKLNGTIIRPFNFYSPRADPKSPYSGVITRFTSRAKEGKSLVIEGDGAQTRDFVHISDVVQMIDLITRTSSAVGKTFNSGTGRQYSISQLADFVISLSSNELDIEHAPPRPGDIKHSFADISLSRDLLGYSPKINLAEGLKELIS